MGVFESVPLSDEVFNFLCEVGIVSFSVASRNVFFVGVLYDCIECVNSFVNVCDWSIVECCEMLFCLISESFPVGSFVICVCGSVAFWGESCFSGDDDWKVIRSEGFDHLP